MPRSRKRSAALLSPRVFRQEAAIYQQFRQTNELAFQVRLRQGLVFSSIFPILNLLSGIAIATIIYFGGRLALGGVVSVGEWYLFVQSLAIYFFPLTSIASFWSQFQQGLSASERVFALIDAEPKGRADCERTGDASEWTHRVSGCMVHL